MNKIKVLFLCTGNSCRSQMSEGLARHLKGDVIEPYSAGTEPKTLDMRAVTVMKEIGIDISSHYSKYVKDLGPMEFNYVVTVCGHANENCPFFPGATKVIHVGFEDPPLLAQNASSEEEALTHYRRVRDEIRSYIESLPESLYKNEYDISLTR
jgi:arsenate reductase